MASLVCEDWARQTTDSVLDSKAWQGPCVPYDCSERPHWRSEACRCWPKEKARFVWIVSLLHTWGEGSSSQRQWSSSSSWLAPRLDLGKRSEGACTIICMCTTVQHHSFVQVVVTKIKITKINSEGWFWVFTKFSTPKSYPPYSSFLKKLLLRLSPSVVQSTHITGIDLDNANHYLALVGDKATKYLREECGLATRKFQEICRNFWITAAKYAISKLPLEEDFLKNLTWIHPHIHDYSKVSEVLLVALRLPQVIKEEQRGQLHEDYCTSELPSHLTRASAQDISTAPTGIRLVS